MHSLTVEPVGHHVAVQPGQTVLEACLRAGVWLPYACGHGLCGTCKVEVLDGEVEHGRASPFALMDFERDEGFALACTATLCSDVTVEADIEEDADAVARPVRDFVGTVSRLEPLTPEILGIWLGVEGEGVRFQAGQYVNVRVDGVDGPRAFSLAGPPSLPDAVELHVRLVPGGAATPLLHDRLAIGDRLGFSGPYGRFFVRRSHARPMLFLAGGSGLSSPKSMILDLLETGCALPITLIHGVRTGQDLYFDGLFRRLEREHPNFRYIPALSDPAVEDSTWNGATGLVHEVAERLYGGSFKGLSAYLCGPPPMIEACIRILMKGRLFERDIFTEKFVTAADGAASLAKSPLFKRV